MNERIRELADQARMGYMFHNNEGNAPGMCSPDSLEKFAELIVKECCELAKSEIVGDEDIKDEPDPVVREYLKGNNGLEYKDPKDN